MATEISPSRIRILPEDLVGRIAAGEVVERPAAVIKELLDNSLDARATLVTVDTADAGLSCLSVTDNGEGMSRDEARLAFTRHATSKIQSDQDLWSIRTLGFRGEALPSIAAVAEVALCTARPGAPVGTAISLRGGVVDDIQDVAVPVGTKVDVRNLFYNTPARKKFLKSPTTEFSHILQVVQQAALAWPSVQFRLLRRGQTIVDYPAVQSLRERLLQVFRPTVMGDMVPVQGEGPGVRVEGVTVGAEHQRSTRTPQDIFINRRAVKNGMILHAVTDAYGPVLTKGRYPQFVLMLTIDPTQVDVNVHPTKREVRFSDNELVHRVVRQAVKTALGDRVAPSYANPGQALARVVDESLRTVPRWSEGGSRVGAAESTRAFASAGTAPLFAESPAESPAESAAVETSGSTVSPAEVTPLGQMNRTYVIARVGDELQIIDQHTAHERVLYERLWRARQAQTVEAQTLLVPVPLEIPAHQRLLIEPHLEEFERLGLGIERFGAEGFLLRTVPALLGVTDGAALVQGLLEDSEDWRQYGSIAAKLHPVIATMACHTAVRAGRSMALPEIQRLVEEWVAEGMVMTCPHGRRVALRLPGDELARIFGRA